NSVVSIIRVVDLSLLRTEQVVKDIGGKFLLEKDGNRVCARAFIDPAGIGLVIVQDKELIAPDNQVATFDPIAFFAGKDGLEREAANVLSQLAPLLRALKMIFCFPNWLKWACS